MAVAAAVAEVAAENRDGSRVRAAMKTWTKGDRVVQPTYGAGTLVEVNEHHTVIDFDEHGRRVFSTRLVALQATTNPAPQKKKKGTRKRSTSKASQAGRE